MNIWEEWRNIGTLRDRKSEEEVVKEKSHQLLVKGTVGPIGRVKLGKACRPSKRKDFER